MNGRRASTLRCAARSSRQALTSSSRSRRLSPSGGWSVRRNTALLQCPLPFAYRRAVPHAQQVVRRDFQAELCNPTPTAAPPSIKRGAKGGAAVSANKQTRQDPALVARVLELGRAGKGLRDIDAQLHADGFLNSKGKVCVDTPTHFADLQGSRRSILKPATPPHP